PLASRQNVAGVDMLLKLLYWTDCNSGRRYLQCPNESVREWREGSEQCAWIEKCLTSVDRQKQPWLIFSANRVTWQSSLKRGPEIAFDSREDDMSGVVKSRLEAPLNWWCVGMMHDD
ncbi:purple acid phosphatase 27, partial [Tanacetum coccineum]